MNRAARWGAVLWPSFFTAGVCTTVFFALVDPLALRDITFPHLSLAREWGYTIGFFMFWSATASACSVTALLLSSRERR